MVRVIVVENHDDLRHLLASRIDREPDLKVVALAASLGEARRRLSSVGCDVVILDTSLPDGYGTELIAQLCSGCAVVILSASMLPESIQGARQAGADEVMDKLDALDEIADAIRRLRNG